MGTKVRYTDHIFAAIVSDYTGREYRFQLTCGQWYVEERIYRHADFYRS